MSQARGRALVVVMGVAVVALAVGLYVGGRLLSPADAAARTAPPKATAITVPVERRALHSQVVTRGDAAHVESVAVELELGELSTRPVVTGQVPAAGDQLAEGEVLLEIVGRPVVALAGELPMYRSLRPGLSGPDVHQLEETLARLDLAPGSVDGDYTAATARAVVALYRRVGYPPPAAPTPEETPLPATEVAYLKTLPRRIDEVRVTRGGVVDGPVLTVSGADLEVVGTVDDADRAQLSTGMAAHLELPDGGTVAATVTALRAATPTDSDSGDVSDGGSGPADQARGRHLVVVRPVRLTPAQATALRGANVRVTIPVRSTRGEVLAVPLAALSAGPGGESRVQVRRGDRPVLVEVRVGLVAQGYAEITPVAGTLSEGDLVVVGTR